MRNWLPILSIFFLAGCFSGTQKDDIESREFPVPELKEDLEIVKGILKDMHAGALAYNTPAGLDRLFDSIGKTITHPLTIAAFYNKVDYIFDRLKCVHSVVYLPDRYYDSISIRPVFFPTPLVDIDGRLYVNSEVEELPLGAEIVSINNIRSADLIQDLKRYYHTDGNSDEPKKLAIDREFAINFFLAYGASRKFTVQFIRDSSLLTETKSIPAKKLTEINSESDYKTFFYYPEDVNYDLEIDNAYKAATLTIRTFSYESYNEKNAFDHFLANSFRLIRQSGIKNLILDLRNNGGGYYGPTYNLLTYLVNKPLQESDSVIQRFKTLTYTRYFDPADSARAREADTAYLEYTKVNDRWYKQTDSTINRWNPDPDLFRGRIFVIVNDRVASAASACVSVLRDKTNVMVLGEETCGSSNAHNAYMIGFVLPNTKLKLRIPLRRYYQPVSGGQHGRGIVPDKKIPLTVRDLIDNIDKPLSYIFDSILVK